MKAKTLIIVSGPTAVGKTKFAIELAKALKTEIISCDSRQFYHEMKIGTAYPSQEELTEVKHHFIGNLNLSDYYNVSIYEKAALQQLEIIFQSSDFAVAVGGSGLYIQALCDGIDELPDADEELRNSIKQNYAQEGLSYLQAEVIKHDPVYYESCDQQNPKRLMRALEVCLATSIPYSQQRTNKKAERPFKIIKLVLNTDRSELNERINARVDQMLENGLVEEAKVLYPFKDLNALNTVGYKELFAYFDGKISLEQAIIDIKTNSRRYAKRQVTWFKRDPQFRWITPQDLPLIISEITDLS